MLLTIALGANLGDRHANLAAARNLLAARIAPLVKASAVVESAAWGKEDQPGFLNQVVVLHHPEFSPSRENLHALLDLTQGIEAELGRERHIHWGPRTIDVDLIFVGDLRYEDNRLSLPHPWWDARDFVGGIIRRELPELLTPLGKPW